LSITALGMALAYLLTIVAGTIEALFTMIWLFRGTAGAATSSGHKTIMEPCERWSPRDRKQTYAPDKNQQGGQGPTECRQPTFHRIKLC
jgi:hypothetical protein